MPSTFRTSITYKNWAFNLGIRGDLYNGLSIARQAEPRLGVAYNIKRTNTILRASYARIMETPFNENLVLSSAGCNDAVVNAIMASIQGYPCITSPLKPSWRNEFHAGFQQAFGKYLVVDAEYLWKYTHYGYDFSIFGSTPIYFPVEWHNSKIPGYAIRVTVPEFHGFTALVVMSSVAARFFQPQMSGIGVTPAGQGGNWRVPYRPRREVQSDHASAIPAMEDWAVDRLQLAVRQRPRGRCSSLW